METIQAQITLDNAKAIQELQKLNQTITNSFQSLSKTLGDSLGKVDGKKAGQKITNDISSEGKKAGVSFGDLFKSSLLANLASSGIQTAISKIFDFGKGFFSASSQMEDFRASFGALVGDVKIGGQLLGEIYDMAGKTPFETTELASSAQMLLQYNVAQEDVLDTLSRLGDASGGNAVKMNSLALAYGQVNAAGKAQMGDINQMINAGFNPLNVIAQKTGKSMGELRGEVEKGAISSQMIKDAFIVATSEGGQFYGMMEAKSKTVSGRLSTLSDQFKTVGMSIMGVSKTGEILKGGLFDVISNGIDFVSQKLALINWNEIGEKIRVGLAGSFEFLNNSVKFISDNFAILSSVLAGFSAGGVALGVVSAFTTISGAITAAGGVAAIFGGIMAVAFAPVTLVIAGIALAVGLFALAWQNNFGNIQGITQSVLSTISSVWTSSWSAISSFFTATWAIISGVFNSTVATISSLWTSFTNTLSTVWNAIWETIKSYVAAVFLTVVALFTGNTGQIGGIWNSFGEKLKSIWSGIWEAVKTALANTWTWITEQFNNLVNTGTTKTNEAGEAIKNAWNSAWEFVKNIDVGAIAKFVIDGFVNGIKNGVGNVMNAMKEMATSAVNAAKENLQIKSPSRVMVEIGSFVSEGMGVGILNGASKVANSVKNITDLITQTAQNKLKNLNLGQLGSASFGVSQVGIMNDGTTPTPTITPTTPINQNPQNPINQNSQATNQNQPTQPQPQSQADPATLTEPIEDSAKKTTEVIDTLIEKIKTGISGAISEGAKAITEEITKMDEGVVKIFNLVNEGWITIAQAIGQNVINGIILGLSQGERSIYSAIASLETNALKAVNIEIQSREEFGEKEGRGAAMGIGSVMNPNVELIRGFKPFSAGDFQKNNQDNSKNVNINSVSVNNNQDFDVFKGQLNGIFVG